MQLNAVLVSKHKLFFKKKSYQPQPFNSAYATSVPEGEKLNNKNVWYISCSKLIIVFK